MLEFLFEHQLQAKYRYVHRWSEGDVLLWDDIGTLHNAHADYGPDEHRLIKRCQVMADRIFDPEFVRGVGHRAAGVGPDSERSTSQPRRRPTLYSAALARVQFDDEDVPSKAPTTTLHELIKDRFASQFLYPVAMNFTRSSLEERFHQREMQRQLSGTVGRRMMDIHPKPILVL